MAILGHKGNGPEASSNPRKKQKIEVNGLKERKKSKTSVGLDALPWSEARLPDRLDDAEGFFGLEEVSDVEVVKDQQLGRLEYRVGEPSSNAALFSCASESSSFPNPLPTLGLKVGKASTKTSGTDLAILAPFLTTISPT